MADIIVIIILVLLIGSSAAYMIRAKKNGVKCIGCPAGGKLSRQRESAEKETCRTRCRKEDHGDIGNELCSLCDGGGEDIESDRWCERRGQSL